MRRTTIRKPGTSLEPVGRAFLPSRGHLGKSLPRHVRPGTFVQLKNADPFPSWMSPVEPSACLDTQQLQAWLARLRAGDATARDELLRCVSARLTALARRMMRSFPTVRHWEQTDDVLQNAVV